MKNNLRIVGALAVGGVLATVGYLAPLLHADTTGLVGSTTPPVISGVLVTPTDVSATVTWSTDQATVSQIAYGTNTSYGASTTLESVGSTTHSATINGLPQNTLYHFSIYADNGSTTANTTDQTFMTLATPVGTTSPTTTNPDITDLQNKVNDLQNQINALLARIQTLESEVNDLMNNPGGGPGTSTPPTGPAYIDQDGASVSVGGSIDFGGHNFGHEENVIITRGGVVVGNAHADSGGNFSTGSRSVPSTPGTYTYHFAGQVSGKSADATITVN